MSNVTIVAIVFGAIILIVVVGVLWVFLDEAITTGQARKKLAKKRLVVVIRLKDGKRTHWETLAIQQLMDLGATVLNISPEDGSKILDGNRDLIPAGAMAFVGVTWDAGDYWNLDGKFLPERSGQTKPNEPVLAPFFSSHTNAETLRSNFAQCITKYL